MEKPNDLILSVARGIASADLSADTVAEAKAHAAKARNAARKAFAALGVAEVTPAEKLKFQEQRNLVERLCRATERAREFLAAVDAAETPETK